MSVEDGAYPLVGDVPDLDRSRDEIKDEMARERRTARSTYPNLFIFRTGSEQLAVGAEADAADVKVASLARRLVDEHADMPFSPDHHNEEPVPYHVFAPVFVS